MKTFIATILLMASAIVAFGQGATIRSKDGIGTNITFRSTTTNFAATANGAGGIYATYQPTWHSNSTYAAPWNFYQLWNYQTDFDHDHPDVVTTFGYNMTPAGVVNANEPALGYIFESRWQNFDLFEQSEWYMYWASPTNGHGTNYAIRFLSFTPQYKIGTDNQTFTSSDLSVESSTFSVKPPNWGGTAPFVINNTPNAESATASLAGYLTTRTNTSNYGGVVMLGGETDWSVPTGTTASHVYGRIDYDNAIGFRPDFYFLSQGISKAWTIEGFTNFSAGRFGLRTPPGTSIATPKVWTDVVEATNSSALTLTGGGVSLSLNSGSIVAEAGHSFSGSGALLTDLNASSIASGTLALARGGTGSSLSDPGANKLVGWDDTSNDIRFWTLGSGFSYDQATDTVSVTGGSGDTNGISYMPGLITAARVRNLANGTPVFDLLWTNGVPALSVTNHGSDIDELGFKDSTGADRIRFVSGTGGPFWINARGGYQLHLEGTILAEDYDGSKRRLHDAAGNLAIDFSDATDVQMNTLAPGTVNATTVNLLEGGSIALDPALSADGTYAAPVTRAGTAGATLAFGDLIVLDPTDSRWELADANSASGADGDARGMIGINLTTGSPGDGDPIVVLLQGVVRADAVFPSFTVNAPVYVSETAGDITATAPTTASSLVRRLGVATTADEIYFAPSIALTNNSSSSTVVPWTTSWSGSRSGTEAWFTPSGTGTAGSDGRAIRLPSPVNGWVTNLIASLSSGANAIGANTNVGVTLFTNGVATALHGNFIADGTAVVFDSSTTATYISKNSLLSIRCTNDSAGFTLQMNGSLQIYPAASP